MPSPPRNGVAPGTWYRVGVVVADGIGHGQPGHHAPVDPRRLQHPGGQVAGLGVAVAVQEAVDGVLRQVDGPPGPVDRRALVEEPAHAEVGDGRSHPQRVDLEDAARRHLLARQPGSPWRVAAGAVAARAVEQAAGVDDRARVVEPDHADAATRSTSLLET